MELSGKDAADDSSDVATLPRREVIRRLRERGEPILLFGEADLDSFKRLRRSEILEPEVNKVTKQENVYYYLDRPFWILPIFKCNM